VIGSLGVLLCLRDGHWLRTIGLGALICVAIDAGGALPGIFDQPIAHLARCTGAVRQRWRVHTHAAPPAHPHGHPVVEYCWSACLLVRLTAAQPAPGFAPRARPDMLMWDVAACWLPVALHSDRFPDQDARVLARRCTGGNA
jgi:hypothetical protein